MSIIKVLNCGRGYMHDTPLSLILLVIANKYAHATTITVVIRLHRPLKLWCCNHSNGFRPQFKTLSWVYVDVYLMEIVSGNRGINSKTAVCFRFEFVFFGCRFFVWYDHWLKDVWLWLQVTICGWPAGKVCEVSNIVHCTVTLVEIWRRRELVIFICMLFAYISLLFYNFSITCIHQAWSIHYCVWA